jgi:hypothetical protein
VICTELALGCVRLYLLAHEEKIMHQSQFLRHKTH